MEQVTIKEALDILDESGRRKTFNLKTRYSRDPTKEQFSFDMPAYQEDYFRRKRAKESDMQARF